MGWVSVRSLGVGGWSGRVRQADIRLQVFKDITSAPFHPRFSPAPADILFGSVTAERTEMLRQIAGSARGWSAGRWGRSWARHCSRCRRRVRTGRPAWCGCRCRWGRWFAPPSGGSETAAAPAGCAAPSSRCRGCSPLLFGLREGGENDDICQSNKQLNPQTVTVGYYFPMLIKALRGCATGWKIIKLNAKAAMTMNTAWFKISENFIGGSSSTQRCFHQTPQEQWSLLIQRQILKSAQMRL